MTVLTQQLWAERKELLSENFGTLDSMIGCKIQFSPDSYNRDVNGKSNVFPRKVGKTTLKVLLS